MSLLSSESTRRSHRFLLPGGRALLAQLRCLGAQHRGRLSKATRDRLQFRGGVVAGYRSHCVQQRMNDGINAPLHSLRCCGCTMTLRRLEFAQGQRNWTAGGTDGWREPAEDAHKQSENDAAGEKFRRDAEGECQM